MNIFLILHLAGAAIALLAVGASLGAVVLHRRSSYRPLALAIAGTGAYQLITGALLSYQAGSSALTLCARAGLYIGVLVAVEVMLVLAARRVPTGEMARVPAVNFPTRAVTSLFGVGVAIVAVTAGLLAAQA